MRITREVVDSALEDNEWKSLGVWENVTPHTFVMPYPASVLSGIRSMMLAPEDMKMNLAPLGMSGTQAWKRARDPRVYQGVSEQDAWCEVLERWMMMGDETSTELAKGRLIDAWTGDEES